jgi:PAS domain S-box-containing protein
MAWLGWLVTRELRRRAALDAALRASEQRFARAFHASPTAQAISEIDTSQFIDVNRRYAELLGYESGYMIGRRALAMGVWHDPAARSALLDGLGEDGSVREARVRLVRKDGAVRDVLLSVVKMRAGRPDRPVLVSLATDITERLAAEREVRRLNADLERRVAERTAELESAVRELEAFSYSVSHDLRAPLRHVDGYASLLTGRLPEGDAVSRKHLRSIVDAVARMGRLIDDLLAFSRAGRAQLRREPVDLDALVAEIVDECARDAAGRSVSWRIAALPVVNGDGALLRQAFVNLLGNALKFTAGREHASIAVAAAAADGEVRICVADNGAGFDMQYADQLFTPFRRLHRADEFKGNGIGLATVRRIVDRHGGRVWAEGVPGGGARFHLALPAS